MDNLKIGDTYPSYLAYVYCFTGCGGFPISLFSVDYVDTLIGGFNIVPTPSSLVFARDLGS